MQLKSKLAIVSAAVIAAGCGGSDSSTPTTTVSGTLIDGYLAGATVCVDVNKNGACDAGEPVSSATGADGKFTIAGVKEADATGAPLVAVVPATAVDADTSAAVGAGFVLMTPAGKTVVSPLTTLVQQALLADSTKTADTAATELKAYISSLASVDVFANYVAANNTAAHEAAKVVAGSLKANYDKIKAYASGDEKNLAIVLGEVAKQALQSQGLTPDATKPVGAEDLNTLRAALASRKAASATQDVSIAFDLFNGAAPVRCGDTINLANTALWDHTSDTKLATPGTIGAQITEGKLVDTRFYISNVMLLDAAGKATPLVMGDNGAKQAAAGVALMDFGNVVGTTCTTDYNTSISGKVAPGTYTGVSFTLGVPVRSADFKTKLNHTNTADTSAPAPLQVSPMSWTWQGGRKFTKIEFQPTTPIDKVGANTATKWYVHIGSTGCAGDPTAAGNETACTNPNRLNVQFSAFNAGSQKIVFDVAALFKEADVTFDGGGAGGCMSGTTDPECPAIFKALGLDITTGRPTNGGADQTVFSVKSK